MTAGLSRFAYRAARPDGAIERGTVSAESVHRARRSLAAQGLWPVEVKETHASRGRRLSTEHLALGMRVLATLLKSGLTAGRALTVMPELVPAPWHAALQQMALSVREGSSLAGAMATCDLAIPPVAIAMLGASEEAGALAAGASRVAEMCERLAATRSAIRSSLAYPAVLALAGTASIGLLVTVVLPRFAGIVGDLGQSLPPTTRAVLDVAAMFRVGVLPAVLLGVVAVVTLRAWKATSAGAIQWHALLLRTPFVGVVRRSIATSRACESMAALLMSGVPTAAAFTHAASASGDAAIQARLLRARDAVIAGERPSNAIQQQDAMTIVATQLLRVGEEAGTLAAMLAHAARVEGERARERVVNAVRLLEPALILIFAGVVAFVAAALLQAIYSIRPA